MTRPPASRPTGRSRRVLAAGLALAAVAAGAASVSAPAQARDGEPVPVPTPDVTMVQANIATRLTGAQFQADARTVVGMRPDFISYNEVMFRHDTFLAPAGYAMYRDARDRFTAETAVAWRTDRWTAVAQGTAMVSNWRGKPPGRQVELGRRYANWVRLQSLDGRVVTVVAAHTAPVVKGMPDLIQPSVKRLGALVDTLAASGPVLVGGDFNVGYRSPRYPTDLLAAHALVPTFDSLGTKFATGDHQGATIDYVFERDDSGALAPVEHHPVELKSDHDAVVAGFSWLTDAPGATQVVTNQPRGARLAQRAALTSLLAGVRGAPAGATLRLATRSLELPTVVRELRRAVSRGVHVDVLTTNEVLTVRERRLARALAADPASRLRQCGADCRAAWSSAGVPATLMLVGDAAGAWTARYDLDKPLSAAMVSQAARLVISTGRVAVADGEALLTALG